MRQDPLGAAAAAPLRLPGAPNFRELGGLPTRDGRRVAPGRVYRSEAFTALQEEEWEAVAGLGLRLVCDLRSPQERDKHPIRWVGDEPRIHHLAILPDVRSTGEEIMRRILSDPSGGATRELLLENYAAMPAAFEDGLRHLVESIVDRRELPMMINCAAGKDRTGFVCSLLLHAVGVAHEDIVEDYLRSNESFDPEFVRAAISSAMGAELEAPPGDAVLDALKCRVEYLDSAYAAIEDGYGGIDAYLERAGALGGDRREQLRAALLD